MRPLYPVTPDHADFAFCAGQMKSRALALDASLDSLKASFQSISQLSASLSNGPRPDRTDTSPRTPPRTRSTFDSHTTSASTSPTTPTANPSRRLSYPSTPITPNPTRTLSTAAAAASSTPSDSTPFAPLTHLPALLSLPLLLRALLEAGDKARADGLWGLWEPAVRAWEEAGVSGARDVADGCREALRAGSMGRRGVVGGAVD